MSRTLTLTKNIRSFLIGHYLPLLTGSFYVIHFYHKFILNIWSELPSREPDRYGTSSKESVQD